MNDLHVPYILPRDNLEEGTRLNLQHAWLLANLQTNILAPIEYPGRILDVGCGTGIWCREVARALPGSQVIGMDLSVPLGEDWPENCTFRVGNVLSHHLPFDAQFFDYVHQRLLIAAIPADHWQDEINELVRITRPGGWLECVELRGLPQQCGPITRRISSWLIAGSQRRGIDLCLAAHLGEKLLAAGLSEVDCRELAMPLYAREGSEDDLNVKVSLKFYQAIQPMAMQEGQISSEEYQELLTRLPEEWAACRTSMILYVFYGQKPAGE